MSNGNGVVPPQPGQLLFRYYGNVLSIQQSGAQTDGYLSSVDWNRFNNTVVGASPVQSVFGRTGAIVAATGDYTLSQIAAPTTTWTISNSVRIKASGAFQLWNPDQNAWHTLQVRGLAGAEYLTIGAADTTP